MAGGGQLTEMKQFTADEPFAAREEMISLPHYVEVPPDTPLHCFYCHDCEAPEYRLHRAEGKYMALSHRRAPRMAPGAAQPRQCAVSMTNLDRFAEMLPSSRLPAGGT